MIETIDTLAEVLSADPLKYLCFLLIVLGLPLYLLWSAATPARRRKS